MKGTVAAVALLLVLIGCGDGITTGTITSKEHHDAYDYIRLQCGGWDSKGQCTTQVPITEHVESVWRLHLRAGNQTGWVDVDERTYRAYNVGGHYPDRR